MTDMLEGEVIETALTVREPERLSALAPEDTIGLATRMATTLRDVVERQRLYAVISGKKYPQVEAWMTIARMDNVVAREARPPVRNDDGSYEAFVELIRLSDGMVIGAGSALCGTPDDKPWAGRAEPARRSMAVTRATSRAFRQQYSWIMALAGYEPTPAEEMPHDAPRNVTPLPASADDGYAGTAEAGKPPSDFEPRGSAEGGYVLSFRLVDGRKGIKVICADPLASALAAIRATVEGQPVTCWGPIHTESFQKDGRTIKYNVLTLEKIQTADLTLPSTTGQSIDPDAAGVPSSSEPTANPSAPFSQAELDGALA